MAPQTSPPQPGSMTVPPLFGWEVIAAVLIVLVALAVAFVAFGGLRGGRSARSDWQAWLDARSGLRRDGPVGGAATDAVSHPASYSSGSI